MRGRLWEPWRRLRLACPEAEEGRAGLSARQAGGDGRRRFMGGYGGAVAVAVTLLVPVALLVPGRHGVAAAHPECGIAKAVALTLGGGACSGAALGWWRPRVVLARLVIHRRRRRAAVRPVRRRGR